MQRSSAKTDLSLVICYEGPRGSGKTLSVAVAAADFMVRYGLPVWSNFYIHFIYEDEKGERKEYSAHPLNMNALYTMDSEIRGGLVCLDELNLWCSNRRSMSVANRLLNSMSTLIRKRQLSFLIPVQNHLWLDKNMIFQIDSLVSCYDLSYRYHHLKGGQLIQQRWRDKSGLATGTSYDESHREYTLTLTGTPFFHIYNSYQEYDVLQATKPVKLDLGQSVITYEDINESVSNNGKEEIVLGVFEQLRQTGSKVFRTEDIRQYLRTTNLPEMTNEAMGRLILRCGAKKKQEMVDGERNTFYEIP